MPVTGSWRLPSRRAIHDTGNSRSNAAARTPRHDDVQQSHPRRLIAASAENKGQVCAGWQKRWYRATTDRLSRPRSRALPASDAEEDGSRERGLNPSQLAARREPRRRPPGTGGDKPGRRSPGNFPDEYGPTSDATGTENRRRSQQMNRWCRFMPYLADAG